MRSHRRRATIPAGSHDQERHGEDHCRQYSACGGYPAPPPAQRWCLPERCPGIEVARCPARHHGLQTVHEVRSLAAQASLNNGDVFKYKSDHRKAASENPLNLVPVGVGIHDESYAQRARAVLDDLEIAQLIPERPMNPEHIRSERPPAP